MTTINPQDASVLLILGEVRGDVKGIAKAINTLEANINAVEAASDVRFSKLETRVGSLEAIKLRIGGLAIGVGLFVGFTADKLPSLINILIGG
jgi:hypothetical protein